MRNRQERPTRHAYAGVLVVLVFALGQSFICWENDQHRTIDGSVSDSFLPAFLLFTRTLVGCLPLLCFFGMWALGRFRSLEGAPLHHVWGVTLVLGVLLRVTFLLWEVDALDRRQPFGTIFEIYLPTLAGWYVFLHGQLTAPSSTLSYEESLRALRAQLQPHFLFNTLHAIGVTAKQDPDAAQRMTTLLGDLLRAALVDRGGKLVSVSEELSLLQPYVQLQQVRFQDRLRLETDVPPRLLSAQVPDLLLQPLVENAIEHGIEQRPGAGLVRIVVRTEDGKLVVEVEDDGPGPAQEGEPKDVGVGLGATIQRIRLLFAAEAWLELRRNRHGGTTTQVKLPLEYVKAAG